MNEQVTEFLKTLSGLAAVARMFPMTHRQFQISADRAFDSLQEVLKHEGELLFGIVEQEIIYGDQVLFQLSEILLKLIEYIKKKKIEKIYFYREITKDEFVRFVAFVVSPEEFTGDPQEYLELLGIRGIRVSHLMTPEEEQKKKDEESRSPYENALVHLSECHKSMSEDPGKLGQLYSKFRVTALMAVNKVREECPQCFAESCTQKYDAVTVHALNTSVISVYAASKMGFTPDETVEIALAALLAYSGRTSDASQRADLDHRYPNAVSMAKAMLKFPDIFGRVAIAVCLEQGLPFDKTLRKTGIGPEQNPHPVSMLISLAEIYDQKRMSAESPQGCDPQVICRRIFSECPGWFHPQLTERFMKIMSGEEACA